MAKVTKQASQKVKYNTTKYKGFTLLVLNPEDRFPFQFGPKKAHMILEHLEEIQAYAKDHPYEGGSNGREE